MSTILSVKAAPTVIEPDAPPTVTVDLTPIGGNPETRMLDDGTGGDRIAGDGIYALEVTVPPEIPNGLKDLVISSMDSHLRVDRGHIPLAVVSAAEVAVYRDEMVSRWNLSARNTLSDPSATSSVYEGAHALEISLDRSFMPGSVSWSWEDPEGFNPFGYELVFHILVTEPERDPMLVLTSGDGKDFQVSLGDRVGDPGVWQEVPVSLEMLTDSDNRLADLSFEVPKGSAPFYIDNLKFVPEEMSMPVSPPTAVEVSEGNAVPSGYTLSQNYPNPFNPETTIRYELPEAGTVRLSLYTVSGQLVRTLVDGKRSAGTYSVSWDGRDDAGRDVASGVYLSRMVVGQFSAVRKLVLTR